MAKKATDKTSKFVINASFEDIIKAAASAPPLPKPASQKTPTLKSNKTMGLPKNLSPKQERDAIIKLIKIERQLIAKYRGNKISSVDISDLDTMTTEELAALLTKEKAEETKLADSIDRSLNKNNKKLTQK
jgi:hypothetical protein